MTVEREKLKRIVNNVLLRKHTGIMAAADAYAAAERLKEHVKVCREYQHMSDRPHCADAYYCDRAPKEGR